MSILKREFAKSKDKDPTKTITIREFRDGIPLNMPLWVFYKQMLHLFKTAKKYKLDLVTYDISGVEYSLSLILVFEEFLRQGGIVTYRHTKERFLEIVESFIFISKLGIFPNDIIHIIRIILYSSMVNEKNISDTMMSYDLTGLQANYLASRT
jgi:hypothetical protein